MFRAEIYINSERIDKIEAINLGRRRPKSKPDERQYLVNVASSLQSFRLYHNRDDGWEELLSKILKKMKEKNEN